eukprot:2022548-Pyramimonas_sp.AAC.1
MPRRDSRGCASGGAPAQRRPVSTAVSLPGGVWTARPSAAAVGRRSSSSSVVVVVVGRRRRRRRCR